MQTTASAPPESDDDLDLSLPTTMFEEPPSYRKPSEPPRYITHTLLSGQTLRLRLVGHNPLWGHHLWNGAIVLSTYLQKNPHLVTGKNVLELGAGAGLPSLVAAGLGARNVVVTDFPDADLVENLEWNVAENCPQDAIHAAAYLWGADPTLLLSRLEGEGAAFDILLLADLLFNHHCHEQLVDTICRLMRTAKEARALTFFTPYRPWLLEKDMKFFDVCRGRGLRVDLVAEEMMEKVMFEEDRGDERMRRRVWGYEVSWGEVEGRDGGNQA